MNVLDYYRKYSISTEHGVDSDWNKHLARRKKLYRQLGIPVLALRESYILEVGPGEGHNALPLLKEWNAAHVDLVEPNEVARKELEQKFKLNNVQEDKYTIYAETLFEYKTQKKYDIVIAEGFFHNLENWEEYLMHLVEYTHENSIVIVTCSDEISFYIEKMKRTVLRYLTKEIQRHDEKIKSVKKIVKPQLALLKGMSRSLEDWIEDMIFFPYNEEWMTMKKAIEAYEDKFDVLGASQNIFVDWSWYKDLEYDYISSYKKQYDEKRHMLLLAGDDYEVSRKTEENDILEKAIIEANQCGKKIEEENEDILKLIPTIKKVSGSTNNPTILKFNEELIKIIGKIKAEEKINWAEYKMFMSCFGKTLQYVSFEKKSIYV